MNLEIVSKNLIKLRQSNNWTQDVIAKKLNVSRQAISKWETGTSVPSVEALLSLSKLYNISINEILESSSSILSDFEDIVSVDDGIIRQALSTLDIKDIVVALMGASPGVTKFVKSIFIEMNYDKERAVIGSVRITEVEHMQNKIVEMINSQLQSLA